MLAQRPTQITVLIRRFAVASIIAILVIMAIVWSNRPAELLRTPASIGGHIVLHAILEDPSEAYNVRRGITTESLRPIGQSGLTLILSHRDDKTSRYLDWNWFKCIEVTDRFGNNVHGWQVRVDEWDQSRRHSSSSLRKFEMPNGYRFLSIQMPHVETDGNATYRVLDTDDNVVAQFVSPRASREPGPEFTARGHQPESNNNDWNVRISEMRVDVSGIPSAAAKWQFSRSLSPKYHFQFRGHVTPADEVVVFDSQFSDGLGNVGKEGSLLKTQPIWKHQMKIARGPKSDHFEPKELERMGQVSASEKQPVELARSMPIISSVLYPAGQHVGKVTAKASDTYYGQFQNGVSGRNILGIPEFVCRSSRSIGGQEGFRQELKYSRTFSSRENLNGGLEAEATIRLRGENQLLVKDCEVTTVHPMLIIQLQQPLESQVLNVICFDQLQRRLKVHALPSDFPTLVYFLIEQERDTTSIELFSCIETLTELDFFLASPIADLPDPNNQYENYMVELRATKTGWDKIDKTMFEKLP